MSPPKDDDTLSAAPVEDPRKVKRGRGRPRKNKAENAGENQEALPGIDARPEPQAREPAPREPAPEAVRPESQSAAAPATGSPAPESQAPAEPASAPSSNGGQQRPQHGEKPQHGEWQDRGDRNFWKRNKRKRGRFGSGGWQPGGPGGGGHPPQPAPPSGAPIFGELPDPARFADLAALDAVAKDISSGGGEPLALHRLYGMTLAELTAAAREQGVPVEGLPNRRQLLGQIFAFAAERKRAIADTGYIDLTDRGAFVVHEHVNYRLYPEDAYLPDSLVRRYGLKRGHRVGVLVQSPREGERCPSVVRVDEVMGGKPEEISKVPPFEELIPYYPLQRILLEAPDVQKDVSMRAVDILTPIGFGQRGLIVAPPRTGKTILLQNIANSISENSPEVKLILLLVDERPEEVTDFKRHTKGEVVSSTFDETPESHVHCAEMVGEKARRLVEMGGHVVILLDSITRLARAYNALASNSGKIMSGGMEATALQKPKRFFGAARNIEGAGSLTIIATALIDTGSRMDEVIFEEFKGTGNMELHLDRGLVERRIFPAINIDRSGTRKEELIYHPDELQRIYGLRRAMQGLGPIESMEMLIQRLRKTKSNAEFLLSLSRQ
ncbi:MAG: transcription termination factor Rho [Opitutaceae bacterium]